MMEEEDNDKADNEILQLAFGGEPLDFGEEKSEGWEPNANEDDESVSVRSKSKPRMHKKKQGSLDGDGDQTHTAAAHEIRKSFLGSVLALYDAFPLLVTSKQSCESGFHFVIIGVIAAFVNELFQNTPQYNVAILMLSIVSKDFPSMPKHVVRPQVVISILLLVSFAWDIIVFMSPKIEATSKVLTAIVLCTKLLTTKEFLTHSDSSSGTNRARKYLYRRFRVFFLSFTFPRRLMREIRGRILAVGMIQGFAALMYLVLFIVSIVSFGYSNIVTAPRVGIPLSVFLLVKAFTSLIVFSGVIMDADVVLSLAYFGCLGFAMKFAKRHFGRKRDEYKGWPLAYSFNNTRFQMVCAAKVVDFGWGIAGWITLGSGAFGDIFLRMSVELKSFIVAITLLLILTDVHTPTLLLYILRLIKHLKKSRYDQKDTNYEDSDDSELDELGYRDKEFSSLVSQRKSKERHRRRKEKEAAKRKNKSGSTYYRRRRRDNKYGDVSSSESESDDSSSASSNGDDVESQASSRFDLSFGDEEDDNSAPSSPLVSKEKELGSAKKKGMFRVFSPPRTPPPSKYVLSSRVVSGSSGRSGKVRKPGDGEEAGEEGSSLRMDSLAGDEAVVNSTPRTPEVTGEAKAGLKHLPISPTVHSKVSSRSARPVVEKLDLSKVASPQQVIVVASPVDNYPGHGRGKASAAGGDAAEEEEVPVPSNGFLDPEQFSQLWERLPASAHFACRVSPATTGSLSEGLFDMRTLVFHLKDVGFLIMAVTEMIDQPATATKLGKLFAYSISSNVTFLLELDILATYDQGNYTYGLTFQSKCTDAEKAADFVQQVGLGDVFDVLE